MPGLRYSLGVDPGQRPDPAAVVLVEHEWVVRPVYQVRGLHRYPLGTSYVQVVEDIVGRVAGLSFNRRTLVAVDATGVGAPVVDLLKGRVGDLYAVTITAGAAAGGVGRDLTVPKRDLINTTAVLLQQRRVRIASDLDDASVLVSELLGYRVNVSDAGHQTYGPGGSGDHDDLVVALSLALWVAEHKPIVYGRVSNPNKLSRPSDDWLGVDRYL